MEDINIFLGKEDEPTDKDLKTGIGSTYKLWNQLHAFVMDKYPAGIAEWNCPGKKYGWSYRIKDKKRAIIYLLPRDKYFKAAFVFGQKAFDMIMQSDIKSDIKKELQQAKKYAEGRGIRIDVKDELSIPDIKKLVEIKLAN